MSETIEQKIPDGLEPVTGYQNVIEILSLESEQLSQNFLDIRRGVTAKLADNDTTLQHDQMSEIIMVLLRAESFMYYLRDYVETLQMLKHGLDEINIHEQNVLNTVNSAIADFGLRKELDDTDGEN